MTIHDTTRDHVASLADLIELVEQNERLSASRRRDLISAITTTARLLNRNAAELPASAKELRERLSRIHPTQAGMTAKRFANIRSDLAAALKHTVTPPKPKGATIIVSPAWVSLREGLETDWQRYTLSRLARFCSAANIAPAEVSDAIIEHFRKHLSDTHLAKNPDKIVKITRETWNGIVSRSGAELPMLTKPPSRRFITRPLSEYPKSFQDDLDAWLARLSSASMFDEDAPPKALRPTSLRNIKAGIRQFGHALVEEGRLPESLTTLADLIEINTYKLGLQHFVERNDGELSAGLSNMAGYLVAIAKHHLKISPQHLAQLRSIKSRLVVENDGLTEKNKRRLRQFEDEQNIHRLLGLPRRLWRKAEMAREPSSRDALLVLYAVTIEILLACPMRVGNLASLDIEKHLRWHGQGRDKRLAVVIPGTEVKNGQPIEVDLPKESVALFKAYLSDWRPLISKERGDALFPNKAGHARLPGHLSEEMKRAIFRETGIDMNIHLFRHIAGKLYLDQHPGEYETVRRLLGHRRLATTTSFYAPLENRRAVERYGEFVLSKRRAKR